jgi:hypothetical protein
MMIQVARSQAADNGADRSTLEPESAPSIDISRGEQPQLVQVLERFVARRPRLCLAAAMSLGIALGWWVKRS